MAVLKTVYLFIFRFISYFGRLEFDNLIKKKTEKLIFIIQYINARIRIYNMLKKFNNTNIKGCKQGFCPGGCLHSFQEFWENYQLEVNSHLQLKNVIKCNINFLKKSANLYYSLPKPFLSILLFLQKFPIFYMYKNKIEFKILIFYWFLWLL